MSNFTQREKLQLGLLLKELFEHLEFIPIKKSCSDCKQYDTTFTPPRCRLANLPPPAAVVAVGCESHEFDPSTPPF